LNAAWWCLLQWMWKTKKKLFSTDISSDHEGISLFQINIGHRRHWQKYITVNAMSAASASAEHSNCSLPHLVCYK
jgi:hypothetical protein